MPYSGPDGRQELDQWLKDNADTLPAVVKDALSHYNFLLIGLAGDPSSLSSTLLQLRRALGITASSEKRKDSGDPIGPTAKPGDGKPKDPKERLQLSLDRCQDLENWHKDLARKLKQKGKKLKEAITRSLRGKWRDSSQRLSPRNIREL